MKKKKVFRKIKTERQAAIVENYINSELYNNPLCNEQELSLLADALLKFRANCADNKGAN